MDPEKMKTTKLYMLTEEELERFDHMLTALGQAYWALVMQRSITVPAIAEKPVHGLMPEEESFYQYHLDLNNMIDDSSF